MFVKRQHHHPQAGSSLKLVLPLGPALGSPVWHGVSGSPRELNCVERSLQRDLPSAPHSQPESGETKTMVMKCCVWWKRIRSSTPTWSSSCAFLLRSPASSFNCSFLLRSSSSRLSYFDQTKRHWSGQAGDFLPLVSESLLQHVTTVILILTGTMPENMRERRRMAH